MKRGNNTILQTTDKEIMIKMKGGNNTTLQTTDKEIMINARGMSNDDTVVCRDTNVTPPLREFIMTCREAGRTGDFDKIITTVDALPEMVGCHRQETSPQIMSLLGYKGYALMKLGKFSECLPFLEESRSIRNQLEQQAEEKSHIANILQRPIFQREAMAVDEALQKCHERSLIAINENKPSIVTGVTPETLLEQWHSQRERVKVIAFYQDRKDNPWREFSNFYRRNGCDFDFYLPLELLEIAGIRSNQRTERLFPPVVHCDFSEKAIMLCKAAVMGDAMQYAQIAAAETPQAAKRLGRLVSPWHAERWSRVVCGVAITVLRQKFAIPYLRDVLLSTGNKVLCEATAGDKTWAIGVSIKMPKIYEVPARWKGSNILGWALMEVRSMLRSEHGDLKEEYK